MISPHSGLRALPSRASHRARRAMIVPQQPAAQPPEAFRTEVGVELVPGIPHRREAVAEVHGPAGPNHRLGDAVARADDEIVPRQVELLDDEGKDREAQAGSTGGSPAGVAATTFADACARWRETSSPGRWISVNRSASG